MSAAVVGAHGQDGRLLSEQLERAGRSVLKIGHGDVDLRSRTGIEGLIRQHQPREVYYLAAHHRSSVDPLGPDPAEILARSLEVHVTGLAHFLEAIRTCAPATRLFYAASSHIFGAPTLPVQNELTPHDPRCLYGITKATGVNCCRYYRETHGVFASTGILYNHESPYRGPQFVSQKIVRGARAIAAGKQSELVIGDLSARIDWGYAPDYTEAMQRILALPEGGDFVIATGEGHSVQEFVEIAFAALGLDWRKHVVERPALITKLRRSLVGDASKLRAATGWNPSVSFPQMVRILVESHDCGC